MQIVNSERSECASNIGEMCAALGVRRSTYYRLLRPVALGLPQARVHPRALKPDERQAVLAVLHEERFADVSASEVHAMLLDEGRYLCSERTMYRILTANQEVRERRQQRRHGQ